jgi:hypothetical protein
MQVYHVRGVRHDAVILAETAEDAIDQAIEQGLVGEWEDPHAEHVPLPKGYRIVYDRLEGATEQAALPLNIAAPAPDKPHTVTTSGVKVYDDWRDNVVVDADAPAVGWKAQQDTFGSNTSAPGRSRLASENSENALAWNLFRSLEKAGRLDVVARALGLEDEFQVLYWRRPWDRAEPLPEIDAALEQIEPGYSFHSETAIMLKGRRYLVMVEPTLGKPGAQIRPWERISKTAIPALYETPLQDLLVDMSRWEETMRRFYQLLRHLILADALCQDAVWGLEPRLMAIVNELNRHAGLRSHAKEFADFQRALRLPQEHTQLFTWQTLLARAKATFDPGIQPLLDHVARLSYLQPLEGSG